MEKIQRKVIYLDENNEEMLVSSLEQEYPDMKTAIAELDKSYKSDRAMYRIAVKQRIACDCDDYRDDTCYSFRVNDIVIEGCIVDAEKTALEMFRLG